jgi:Tol biopolymer transport system component
MAEWHGDDWGPAVRLDGPVNSPANEYYPTVSRNGTLYFSSSRPGGQGRGDLYFSRLANGRYDTIQGVSDSVNTAAFEGDAFIAPDESYLVFTGFGRTDGDAAGDLFVSTNRAGSWTAPRRLEHGINSSAQEYAPIVSPDGRWLYFTSYRTPIDEQVVRPPTGAEMLEMGAGPLNGLGNVYRISIEAVLATMGDKAAEAR